VCAAAARRRAVPACSLADACHSCVQAAAVSNAAGAGAASYCGNLDADRTSRGAVAAFYACLASASSPDAPASCWQCCRSGDDASASRCYACLGRVSGAAGIHCSHCWAPSRAAAVQDGVSAAHKCEACVVDSDARGGDGSGCW
jgi:hypothetical protein